ncbi:MAG TPA: hypothetical protein VGM06_04725 [Polyangiaceae bacterium]|jgi:hypothetical protein
MSANLDDDARARLRGRRVSHGVVLVVAVLFIGASAGQIIPAVFGWGARPLPAAAVGSPERTCADGIRGLAAALDRASARASADVGAIAERSASVEENVALRAFEGALGTEWKDTSRLEWTCGQSGAGSDAWAALMRLRRGHEELVVRNSADLAALRCDVTARLPP